MMVTKELWIFAEQKGSDVAPVTFEMLSELRNLAKELHGKTCVCLMGENAGQSIRSLQRYGAEKVYLLENGIISEISVDIRISVSQKLIQKYNPFIAMFGATSSGSELAARVAARLGLPCITEVKRIMLQGEDLVIAKPAYDDKVYKNFVFQPKKTVVLTALPGDFDGEETKTSHGVEVVREDIHLERDRVFTKKIGFIKGDPRKIRLEEADLIVAGGKGIGQDLSMLENLADSLEASIGGTRLLVDDGVIPFERQIGITGKSVSPRFLMACGISGAREFLTGIEKTRLTVAINTDANAPIFRSTDLGVFGDVHEIIPALIKKLNERKAKKMGH